MARFFWVLRLFAGGFLILLLLGAAALYIFGIGRKDTLGPPPSDYAFGALMLVFVLQNTVSTYKVYRDGPYKDDDDDDIN